jgi:hypothetical protein
LKADFAQLDQQGFFDEQNAPKNVYDMFKIIYFDKLHEKGQPPGSPGV